MLWRAVARSAMVGELPAPPPEFDAFFKEFAEKRDGIEVLEADFMQKSIVPEEILTTEGSLIYMPPRRIRFHTQYPNRTTLVEGLRGYEYEPGVKQLVIFDIEDNPSSDILFVAFDSDTERLREHYEVSLLSLSDEPKGSHAILIKPKPENLREAYFLQITLYLRDVDMLPHRIHILNDEESETIINVIEYTVNQPIDAGRMQIPVPEGTRVLENDRVLETVGAGGKAFPGPSSTDTETPAIEQVHVIDLSPPADNEP